jgi:protein-L-isoaspartate(D-aspartate) O-methyltransferase
MPSWAWTSTIILSSKINLRPAYLLWVFVFLLQIPPLLVAAVRDAPQRDDRDPYLAPRRVMIDRDLRGRGIKNERVLTAMDTLPRHLFVPDHLRGFAYDDRPLPIGEGQTISQPYIVALMSELLELKPTDKVLEIGTGSGYQTAVLARLAASVSSIEILPSLGERAKKALDQLNFKNIELKIADGFYGWEERGPFDVILVTAAAPRIPEPLWRQLREGGRLVMPLGDQKKSQRLIRARKVGGQATIENLSEVLFVPLRGAVEKPAR